MKLKGTITVENKYKVMSKDSHETGAVFTSPFFVTFYVGLFVAALILFIVFMLNVHIKLQ